MRSRLLSSYFIGKSCVAHKVIVVATSLSHQLSKVVPFPKPITIFQKETFDRWQQNSDQSVCAEIGGTAVVIAVVDVADVAVVGERCR